MSIFGFIKNGRKQKLNLMPAFYPSSRVTYNNGNVSDALDGKVSKSGDTMSGRLTLTPSNTGTVIESYRTHTDTSSKATDVLLGNNIANGTAGSCFGRVVLYGKGTNYTVIDAPNSTANRTIDFPDKSGILATTDDVDAKVSKSGDTMTGLLTIKRSAELQLALVRDHSDTTVKETRIGIGNQTPNGTTGACYGAITFWGDGAYGAELQARNMTANRTHQLPNRSGTLETEEHKGYMPTSSTYKKERTGAGGIEFDSSLTGHLAFVWIQVESNNYWWIGGNAIVLGVHPFAYLEIEGTPTHTAYINLGFGTNPVVYLENVYNNGVDVTSTSKMVVFVM